MNERIISVAKSLKRKISDYKFDLYHKETADKDLKIIESAKGKTDPKLIKLCDEYAKDVFGWKGYAPWLYVYSAFNECFKEGWIPDNYYGKVVIPKIQGSYGKVSFLKALTHKVFESETFPDIVYAANDFFFTNDYLSIDEKNVKNYLFSTTDKVVFKLDNSKQGLGVFFFDKNTFDMQKIKMLGNGVFQSFIKQHSFFSDLMPTSVSTLRITTAFNLLDTITVRACFLRIARKGETHIQEVSELVIPVDIETGDLPKHGYFDAWIPIESHPDSNFVFENKKIPNYKKCVSTVINLHRSMPFVRCIGWDMTVDENENIKIMEWNGYDNDIKFSEATQGPSFSDLGWENIWKESKND